MQTKKTTDAEIKEWAKRLIQTQHELAVLLGIPNPKKVDLNIIREAMVCRQLQDDLFPLGVILDKQTRSHDAIIVDTGRLLEIKSAWDNHSWVVQTSNLQVEKDWALASFDRNTIGLKYIILITDPVSLKKFESAVLHEASRHKHTRFGIKNKEIISWLSSDEYIRLDYTT